MQTLQLPSDRKSSISYRMAPLRMLYSEIGDYSVITRWTVDQEVLDSNPTHGGNLISVVRSLSGFTQPIR